MPRSRADKPSASAVPDSFLVLIEQLGAGVAILLGRSLGPRGVFGSSA